MAEFLSQDEIDALLDIADTEAEAVFDVCQYILDRSQQ